MSNTTVSVRKSENIATNKIEPSRYELRDQATEYEPRDLDNPFGQLVDSVRKYGILVPIQVVRRTINQYEVVDGGRRLRAAKHVKLDQVPCMVLDISSESEIRKLAIIANLQRLDLTDIEKGHALVKLYSGEGDIIEAMATLRNLVRKQGPTAPNLMRLADSISIPYHSQLDFIEIILGSNPDVQDKMEKHKLATYKKRMVVQQELRKHPSIQKELVTRIKDAPARSAQRIVKQTVDDIKAGVYQKIKDTNYALDYEKRKEAQAKEGQRLREPQHIYLDVMQDIGTLLNTFTNIAVQQLSPERIRSSKYARHMAKGLDDRQLSSLDNKLELLKLGVENMNKAVQDEIETREQTERLGGR
jgi:ParB/RepB/Spo0J family partition protein